MKIQVKNGIPKNICLILVILYQGLKKNYSIIQNVFTHN